MANICNYLIRAKGRKKAALMAFASTPKAGDFDYIIDEFGTDEEYVVWYQGECKWSLDSYSREMDNVKINLDALSEDDLRAGEGYDFWDLTMRQRSEVLGLDLFAHSWSIESEFDTFNRWVNGRVEYASSGESAFNALTKAENIDVRHGLEEIYGVSLSGPGDSHYQEDRIAVYNESDIHTFNITYSNDVLKGILTKYNHHSDSCTDAHDVDFAGEKLSDYRGVRTIEELTDTLINFYLEFGAFDEGLRDELCSRKADIVKGFTSIDGFSVEAEITDYNPEWDSDDALSVGYDFSLANGSYNASYRECWGGW